jgi:hypothetical protein
MSKKMGYYEFHRLPKAERKAFKANGGKVKLPLGTYVVGAIVMGFVVHWLQTPSKPVETFPWTKAEVACLNAVKNATKVSVLDLSAGSNYDWGNDGYSVTINIGDNASVLCYAKADGRVVKLNSIKLN